MQSMQTMVANISTALAERNSQLENKLEKQEESISNKLATTLKEMTTTAAKPTGKAGTKRDPTLEQAEKTMRTSRYCDICKRTSHNTDDCFSNPKSKNYRGNKQQYSGNNQGRNSGNRSQNNNNRERQRDHNGRFVNETEKEANQQVSGNNNGNKGKGKFFKKKNNNDKSDPRDEVMSDLRSFMEQNTQALVTLLEQQAKN